MGDVVANGILQLRDAPENAASNALLRDVTKTSLHQIQPRTAGGREVHMETLVSFQPFLNIRMFMGRVVVDNQMQVQVGGRLGVDLPQEFQPFLMAMLLHALGDHFPLDDFEGRKQGRRSIPFVVGCHRAQSAWIHRQALLRSVEGLDRGLFVTGKHHRMFRRFQVQAHDVDKFLNEVWIVGDLERLYQMRLQAVVSPHALNGRLADAHRLGHRSRRPVRSVCGSLLRGLAENLHFLGRPHGRRPSAARRILADTTAVSGAIA